LIDCFAPRAGLFLDRDGVVNVDTGYVHHPDQIDFIPGIFDLCRTAVQLNLPIIIVTNQSGVALGLYSQADFHGLMCWIHDQFANEGVGIAHVEHSPWYPPALAEIAATDLNWTWVRDSWWRKPGAGMVRRAAMITGVDPALSTMIGDRAGDVAAAREAGIGTVIQFEHEAPRATRHNADQFCTQHEQVIEILRQIYG